MYESMLEQVKLDKKTKIFWYYWKNRIQAVERSFYKET